MNSDAYLGQYWDSRRQLKLTKYSTIEFPYVEQGSLLERHDIAMETSKTIDSYIEFLSTLSVVQRYRQQVGPAEHTLEEIKTQLTQVYNLNSSDDGSSQIIPIIWDFHLVMVNKNK